LCVQKFAKMRKIKIKRAYYVTIFSFSMPNFWKQKSFDFFWPHLDSDFSVVAYDKISLLNYFWQF
jgi:hypothetical protein